MEAQDYDVVVVGGGPAGMTAGLYAARGLLKTVIIEKLIPGGQLNNTEVIENYPGFESIPGYELAEKLAGHAKAQGCEFRQEYVQEVFCCEDGRYRTVRTDQGLYRAKVVIMAPGGENRKLNVPGEKEFAGRGVSYCAICDGAFFKGQVIAVVGGGDAAVEEGIFLTKFGTKVYIIHRRDQLRAKPIIQKEAMENAKVEFIWDTVVTEIRGEEKVSHLVVRNVRTGDESRLDVGAVFVFIGFVPNSFLLKDQVKVDDIGYILTNERMQSSIPGIYAIGDVKPNICKQVSVSVGEGTIAAVDAERYITEGKSRGWWS
jgi:thioredoxin reductase (NADPH)